MPQQGRRSWQMILAVWPMSHYAATLLRQKRIQHRIRWCHTWTYERCHTSAAQQEPPQSAAARCNNTGAASSQHPADIGEKTHWVLCKLSHWTANLHPAACSIQSYSYSFKVFKEDYHWGEKPICTKGNNDYKENVPKNKQKLTEKAVTELNCIYVEQWKRIFFILFGIFYLFWI